MTIEPFAAFVFGLTGGWIIRHLTCKQPDIEPIKKALKQEQFELYYQSIIPLDNLELEPYYEVLIRMRDNQGNLVSPNAFIPIAEQHNLMSSIDKWVISTLFDMIADTECMANFSVNLSGNSLNDPTFVDFVIEQFRKYDIQPSSICFEITETAVIDNLQVASECMHTLKNLGCKFSLDDFGSGLSSFTYLKALPIDILKIDGYFVKDILTDIFDLAMVKSICEVSKTMNIKTIAEFVETYEILETLSEIGVDYVQGYFISRPTPLSSEILPTLKLTYK